MESCIFCKIARKDIPSLCVYGDDLVMAIADIEPVAIGHTLIIPKQHYLDVFDIPEPTMGRLSNIAQKLAKAYKTHLGIQGVNLLNASGKAAQQTVFHFHLHLIPRYNGDGIDLNFKGNPDLREESEAALKKIKLI
jgi:histidine triad (HIT) family protein